ncbi:MAG: hypothetical protein F6K55_39230 [Moorea sp. SIO4A3]|nr:hypothetical protein [Moorena sp. SIO4A3]
MFRFVARVRLLPVTHHCWVKQLLEDAPDFDSGEPLRERIISPTTDRVFVPGLVDH